MHRMRKHIHRRNLYRPVPALFNTRKSRERRRITAHVHHALRLHLSIVSSKRGSHPLRGGSTTITSASIPALSSAESRLRTRRLQTPHASYRSVLHWHAHPRSLPSRSRPHTPSWHAGPEQGYRPDAAIGVDHGLLTRQSRIFHRLAVQHFGLGRVYLIERTR